MKIRTTTMAESAEFQCEPCKHENVAKSASKWCTECDESLCDGCCRSHQAHKISRNHHIITVGEYQQSKTFNVNLNCPDHNKQLDFYCPIHDTVVCVECVQLKHSGCKDPKPINEAAKGAKTSTAFTDLEQTIDGLLENIEKGVQNLQQSKVKMLDQEEETKKSITKKRAEIDKHLNRLQDKILKSLKTESEKEANKITLMMKKLEEKRKTILDLKNTAENMKKYSSNLQVFVGIRSISINIVSEINGIKPLVSSIPQLSIAAHFNPKFDTFIEAFDSLGEIQITSKEAVVPYVERRLIQAQYQRPAEPPVHKLDDLQLKLKTDIKIGGENFNVTNCFILPNKSIMIARCNKPSLTILKEDGSHDRVISVPYNPDDVTIIDDQRVAVSHGSKRTGITCITIVNINNQCTNQTLKNLCKHSIQGITYNDGKLYAVARGEGIKVIDLDGNIIKTIRIHNDAMSTYKVTTQKDKIYYSDDNGGVHCVDMEGTEIWTCQDDRLESLYSSSAIAVDNHGITFAAVYNNNLLLAISPDGKQQKILLTSSDGLQKPDAVYYDKDSKRLLVCNRNNRHAALYDVIY